MLICRRSGKYLATIGFRVEVAQDDVCNEISIECKNIVTLGRKSASLGYELYRIFRRCSLDSIQERNRRNDFQLTTHNGTEISRISRGTFISEIPDPRFVVPRYTFQVTEINERERNIERTMTRFNFLLSVLLSQRERGLNEKSKKRGTDDGNAHRRATFAVT